MGLKTELLHESLVKLLEDIGYGGLSYVARQASLTAAGVKKIKEKDGVPKLESWEKLHNAFPHQIPPPAFEGPATIVRADGGHAADGSALAGGFEHPAGEDQAGGLALAPVFRLDQEGGLQWNEAGLPFGSEHEQAALPAAWLEQNAFILKVGDETMRPTLRPGDLALVQPGKTLDSGQLCLAVWSGEGEKIIRRFRRSGLTIILESDNPDLAPVVLDSQKDRGVKIFRISRVIREV